MPVSGRSPVLVSVTVCAPESWPTAVDANVIAVGDRISVGAAAPVPLNSTDCVPAPSINSRDPSACPTVVGAKANVSWQAAFAISVEVPQELVDMTKGGVILIPLIGTAFALPFVTSSWSEAEVVPTSTCPKLTEAGLMLTEPAGVPLPSSSTFNCPPKMFAKIVICPVRLPVAVGVKTTCRVQLDPGAIV